MFVWLGVGFWFASLSSSLMKRERVRPAQALGLMAGVGFLILLMLGMLLMGGLRGFGQALASTIYLRGLVDLWAVPLMLAAAALLLPRLTAAPLYGWRPLFFGAFLWFGLSVLGMSRDLAPDMLAVWLVRPSEAFTTLSMIPVTLLAIGLFGSYIGVGSRKGRQDVEAMAQGAESGPAIGGKRVLLPRTGRGEVQLLMLAGLILLFGSMWMEALRFPAARRSLQLGPWAAGGLFPAFGGLFLVACAATRALFASVDGSSTRSARVSALLMTLGAALLAAPTLAAGLAESAIGGSAELLVLQAQLRLPGALLLALGALLGLNDSFASLRSGKESGDGWDDADDEADDEDDHGPDDGDATGEFPSASATLATTAAILAAGLIVSILIPLADPSLDRPGARAAVRMPPADSLRADGQGVYTQEACAVCHSQRVRRSEAGGLMGPETVAGDFAGAPSHAGHRRIGPDLSWTGDRYDDPELLAGRLQVHAPGGVAAMPWLFQRGGPTARGASLVEYLDGLSAQAAADGPPPSPEDAP
jgi:hypothetical protein